MGVYGIASSKCFHSKEATSIFCGVILLLILVVATQSDCPAKATDIQVKNGLRVNNLTFVELHTSSLFNCVKQCLYRSLCHSLNFNRVTKLCELNISPIYYGITLIPEPNHVFIQENILDSVRKRLTGPCWNHTCPDYSVCVRNGDSFTCDSTVDPRKYCQEDPFERPFATVRVNGNQAGDTAVYTCDVRYISGLNKSYCRANGKWGVNELICEAVCYGDPPIIAGATYTYNTWLSEAIYSCISGFYASGNRISVCLDNGLWSTNVTILCREPADCLASNLPVSFGAVAIYNTTTEGSIAIYECKTTYIYYSGSITVECMANGQWTVLDLICLPTTCVATTTTGKYIYQGNLTVTETGNTCVRFDHTNSRYKTINFFPYDATMDDVANKCRPTVDTLGVASKPWCYYDKLFSVMLYEYCNIPDC